VLSSECSLEEKVRADGAAWISGMAVRILFVVEEGAPIWPLFALSANRMTFAIGKV